MADHKIETEIDVRGEQQYRQAIKNVNQSLHTLGSELSLASAQFKANGDAQKLMESRSKTLNRMIEEQTKNVDTCAAALENATNKYGKNSTTAQKWQTQLNQAQAKLLNLQRELDNNNKGLDKNGKAFDAAGNKAQAFGGDLKQVDSISKGVNFQSLNTALTNIGGVFERVGQTAAKAWKAVWNTASESSNWADDLATLSLETGQSINTLQKWAYAADFVDTDINDIVKGMTKLVNPSKEVLALMKDLGVSAKETIIDVQADSEAVYGYTVDAWNQAKPAADVFWDIIRALGDMTDAVLQEQAAQTLFGKSYREILPLIKAGPEVWEAYAQQAEDTGAVLADDLVGNLTTFNDSLQRMQNDYEAFQNIFSATIAPGLTEASNAISRLLESLNIWAQSEEGREALGKLSTAIGELVTTFAENIDFGSIAETAAGGIEALTGALDWFSDNGETVKGIIIGVAGAFAGLKISKDVLSFVALMRLGGSGIASAAGGLANGLKNVTGGFAKGVGNAASSFKEFANSIKTGISSAIKVALPAFKTGITAAIKAALPALGTLMVESLTIGLAILPSLIMDALAAREKQTALDEARELADKAADDSAAVSNAKEVVYSAADAMELAVNGLGNSMTDISDTLDNIADSAGVSNKTKLLNLNRIAEGGYTIGTEYELLGLNLRDAVETLSDPDAIKNTKGFAAAVSELNDLIAEADNDMQVTTPYNVMKKLDEVIANDNIYNALSGGMRERLAEYLTDRELFGRKGSQFWTDDLEMLRQISSDVSGQLFAPVLPGDVKLPFDVLKQFSQYKIPEITGERPERELSLSYISDFLDEIIDVNDALEDGYTAENAEAMYQLIDGLKSSNLRAALPKDTNDLLDQYFDLDSGFGAGGPNQFSDARGLLGVIFEDLSNAWDEGISDTTAAEESGKALADAVALGVGGGADAVGIAASTLVARVVSAIASAAVPAVPRYGGGGSTNYSNSNSMYIGSYNNYSGADLDALMTQMARVNRYERQGRGGG